jgi:GNAT superfamily N-acetyltransferase
MFQRTSTLFDIDFAIKIYEASFPKNERQLPSVLTGRILSNRETLYVGRKAGEVVFMALLLPLRGTDCILLDYMAVGKQYRNRGIGREFLSFITDTLRGTTKHLILELEDPTIGRNKRQRRSRIQFYRNHGAKMLRGVRYVLPKLSGTRTTRMVMMITPPPAARTLPGEYVRKLLVTIYKDAYSLRSNHPLVQTTLNSVKARVVVS